jgi:asparagine synthase (glutamine-hydrolysing)
MLRKLFRTVRRTVRRTATPSLIRSVKTERLTYLSHEKLQRLWDCLLEMEKNAVPGELLEFGVALGGSGVAIAQYARAGHRRFHGFDVFGMIPAPDSEKDDAKSRERYRVIAAGESRGLGGEQYYGYRRELFSEVCATFARYGRPVDGETVTLHKGLFEDTWAQYPRTPVALAHIDCDWYAPVKFCLDSIAPLLGTGSVVVLDDYNDYGGCRVATDEFLTRCEASFRVLSGPNLILKRL